MNNNESPDYAGWVAEYGGKTWGEVGDAIHPPTTEGKEAAEDEAQEFVNYYKSKTDDESYKSTLYGAAVAIDNIDGSAFFMCSCCDWGWHGAEKCSEQ